MSASGGLPAAFSDMPLTLKGFTSFFVVFGAGSVLLALAPGVEHRVAGKTLTQAEFFAAGHGAFAVVLGAWLCATALGLLRRAAWGRWGMVAAWGVFVVPALGEPGVALSVAVGLAWAAGTGAYLFRARGPVAYFAAARPR